MSDAVGLSLTAGLLLFNAFFVAAEFALISARRTKIEPLALDGSRRAKITLNAMSNVSLMMAGAQLGITVCSVALGSISEPAIAHLLEVPFAAVGVPESLLHPVAFVIALSMITYLHVVVGEMVPKNLALAGPERSAMILAPPLVVIVRVLFPVLWLLNTIANLSLRLMRVTPKNEVSSTFTTEEVAELVAESRTGGLLEINDEKLLLGALQFHERDISSVLLPKDTVRTVPATSTPAQVEALAATVSGYSRFPVVGGSGEPVGYVHIKDLLPLAPEARDVPLPASVVRALPDVHASDSLRDVLTLMQSTGAHLATVREDATGAELGIVTLEDVLSELVGEIRDDNRRGGATVR